MLMYLSEWQSGGELGELEQKVGGEVGGKKRRQSRKQIVGGEASLRRIQTFVLARRTFPLFHGNRLCLIKPGWGVVVGGHCVSVYRGENSH